MLKFFRDVYREGRELGMSKSYTIWAIAVRVVVIVPPALVILAADAFSEWATPLLHRLQARLPGPAR